MADEPKTSPYDLYGFFSLDGKTQSRVYNQTLNGEANGRYSVGGFAIDNDEEEKQKAKDRALLLEIAMNDPTKREIILAAREKFNKAKNQQKQCIDEFNRLNIQYEAVMTDLRAQGVLLVSEDIEINGQHMMVDRIVFQDGETFFYFDADGQRVDITNSKQIDEILEKIVNGETPASPDDFKGKSREVSRLIEGLKKNFKGMIASDSQMDAAIKEEDAAIESGGEEVEDENKNRLQKDELPEGTVTVEVTKIDAPQKKDKKVSSNISAANEDGTGIKSSTALTGAFASANTAEIADSANNFEKPGQFNIGRNNKNNFDA